jgi:hypothetical protein
MLQTASSLFTRQMMLPVGERKVTGVEDSVVVVVELVDAVVAVVVAEVVGLVVATLVTVVVEFESLPFRIKTRPRATTAAARTPTRRPVRNGVMPEPLATPPQRTRAVWPKGQ